MFIFDLGKKIVAVFLYAAGFIGAMTTAFGVAQAVFSDNLLDIVVIDGSPCNPSKEILSRWEKSLSSNVSEFVYLDIDIHETVDACESVPIGEYPFMTKEENSHLTYRIPFEQPLAANYMTRLELPVSAASAALLADGFVDFYNEGTLKGDGVFFVDLIADPHSGPLYRLVPAPFSVATNRMLKCSASYHKENGFFSRARAYVANCVIS